MSDSEPSAKLRCLVIIPTYCEAESLAGTVYKLLQHNRGVDALIVDDNSPDGTAAIADALAEKHRRVSVLHRRQKEGLGPAYLAGFASALEQGYDVLVEMDADGSHWPEQLDRLLAPFTAGADVVIGARWIPGGAIDNWPLHRRLLSRAATIYARLVLRSSLHDLTSGYRAFTADTVRWLLRTQITSQGYGFQIETAWRSEKSGRTVVEVPITFTERENGQSKMTLRIVLEAVVKIAGWGLSEIGRPSRRAS